MSALRTQATFGAADGLTVILGLLLALQGHPAADLAALHRHVTGEDHPDAKGPGL